MNIHVWDFMHSDKPVGVKVSLIFSIELDRDHILPLSSSGP